MTHPQSLANLLVAGCVLSAAAAQAETPMASVEMLTGTCVACHGPAGNSAGPAIPSVAGLPTTYFIGAMLSYKHADLAEAEAIVEGDPSLEDVEIFQRNGTIMNRIASGYTLAEIKAMAEYFESSTLVPVTQDFDAEASARGDNLHADNCEKCHEDGGMSNVDGMAPIAGQWKLYLQYSLDDFHAGMRGMPKKMKSRLEDVVESTGKEGLHDLIHYYASQQ